VAEPPRPEQETLPGRRSYSPAEAAATYRKMKWSVGLGSLLPVALLAPLVAHWYPVPGLALAVGGLCGIANSLLTMYGNERLVDGRSVGTFVLSSFLRIGLFGIVPVVLALRAPSVLTLGSYFTGFFTPLALYGIALRRADMQEKTCTNK
jgi:hypothetical protein